MSIIRKPEHTGSAFGTPTPEPTDEGIFGPPVKINAVNAARPGPRHRAELPAELQPALEPEVNPAPTPTPTPTPTPAVSPAGGTSLLLAPEHMRVPEGHPAISDHFGGYNRYIGGNDISLNEFGGIDVGQGGPQGATYPGRIVHIHTALVIRVE